jgi:predicted nucleic acid-binding protein
VGINQQCWLSISSPALFLEGLRIAGRYKLHWYHALIVAAALEAKCTVLYK